MVASEPTAFSSAGSWQLAGWLTGQGGVEVKLMTRERKKRIILAEEKKEKLKVHYHILRSQKYHLSITG